MSFLVKHERWKCIGCGNCIGLCNEFWKMNDEDHKAVLQGNTTKKEVDFEGGKETVFSLGISDDKLDCNKDAEDSCPVNCIHVLDK